MSQNHVPSSTRGRVLVVDDNSAIREMLQAFFELEHFEVQAVACGAAALAALSMEHYDVLFVDFQMPGMTGLEVAAAVRKKGLTLPIALITGSPHLFVPTDATQAGIGKIFMKPFNLDELLHWLQSLGL